MQYRIVFQHSAEQKHMIYQMECLPSNTENSWKLKNCLLGFGWILLYWSKSLSLKWCVFCLWETLISIAMLQILCVFSSLQSNSFYLGMKAKHFMILSETESDFVILKFQVSPSGQKQNTVKNLITEIFIKINKSLQNNLTLFWKTVYFDRLNVVKTILAIQNCQFNIFCGVVKLIPSFPLSLGDLISEHKYLHFSFL